MKNKGFTLVELLGVITILGIIALIAIPSIDYLVGNNKEKLRDVQINTILDGLKTWGDANTGALPENDGDSIIIKLAYLKKSGFLTYDFNDPTIEGACFSNDMILKITNLRGSYKYEVEEIEDDFSSDSDCIDVNNATALSTFDTEYPAVIILKGNEEVKLAIGSTYTDSGAFLLGVDGSYKKVKLSKTIKNSAGSVVNSISTASAGTYTITYKSSEGLTKVRKVIVE